MGGFSGTPVNPGGPYREHREVPRFTLIASIELREPHTDTRISGRISEISRKGCYVDVLITLPEGTGLDVRISRDQGVFETKGKIVYVQHGMGMGVTFLNPAPEQLSCWIPGWPKYLRSVSAPNFFRAATVMRLPARFQNFRVRAVRWQLHLWGGH